MRPTFGLTTVEYYDPEDKRFTPKRYYLKLTFEPPELCEYRHKLESRVKYHLRFPYHDEAFALFKARWVELDAFSGAAPSSGPRDPDCPRVTGWPVIWAPGSVHVFLPGEVHD